MKEIKSFPLKVDRVGDTGEFTGYASTFGDVDQGGDVVDRGAFKKTLRENGGKVPVLDHHDPTRQIGWNLEAKEDDRIVYSLSPAPTDANYGFAVDLKTVDADADDPFFIGCRTTGDTDGYWARFTGANKDVSLYKIVSGTPTKLMQGVARTPTDGDRAEIRCDADNIAVYVNGVEIARVTDSSITAIGKAGMAWGDLILTTEDVSDTWRIDNPQVHLIGNSANYACSAQDHNVKLQLWLEAADSNHFTLSTLEVDQWWDKSGKDAHAVQATAGEKPDFVASDADYNNRGVVDFPGDDTGMELVATLAAATSQDWDLWIVWDVEGTASSDFPRLFADNDNSPSSIPTVSGDDLPFEAGTTITDTNSGFDDPIISRFLANGVSSAIYENGGSPVASGDAGANEFGTSGFHIGNRATGSRELQGRIAEIALFDPALTTAEANSFSSCLGTKYNKVVTTIP